MRAKFALGLIGSVFVCSSALAQENFTCSFASENVSGECSFEEGMCSFDYEDGASALCSETSEEGIRILACGIGTEISDLEQFVKDRVARTGDMRTTGEKPPAYVYGYADTLGGDLILQVNASTEESDNWYQAYCPPLP